MANPTRPSACAWRTQPLVGHPRGVALLGLPDDQSLACRLHHLFGHGGQGVNVENPLDLRQEAIQQPEVAAGDPDDRRGGDRVNGVTSVAAVVRVEDIGDAAHDPALSGPKRDRRCCRDAFQRAAILQVGLEETEPGKGELSGLFRQPRRVVHTRRVRQLPGKVLRLIICNVLIVTHAVPYRLV